VHVLAAQNLVRKSPVIHKVGAHACVPDLDHVPTDKALQVVHEATRDQVFHTSVVALHSDALYAVVVSHYLVVFRAREILKVHLEHPLFRVVPKKYDHGPPITTVAQHTLGHGQVVLELYKFRHFPRLVRGAKRERPQMGDFRTLQHELRSAWHDCPSRG